MKQSDSHPSTRMDLPEEVARLFWDVDPASVDLELHADYVIERVMSRGGWKAMRWLRRTFSTPVLARFLRSKGSRLAPRERAYWALMTDVELSAGSGGGTPKWAAP